MNNTQNIANSLGYERIGKLLTGYSIPGQQLTALNLIEVSDE